MYTMLTRVLCEINIVLLQTIRVNAKGVVFWSRHTLATYIQPKFQFSKYPSDEQTIHIRFGSYAYDKKKLIVGYGTAKPLSYNDNFDKSLMIYQNPTWSFMDAPEKTYYSTYTSGSGFVNAIYHLTFKRQAQGIIVRLVLPITLLLFLAGLSYWSPAEIRVDSTTTLLLSVSALYIVILGNIPMLGYLTAVDSFVFVVSTRILLFCALNIIIDLIFVQLFLLLIVVIFSHQIYNRLAQKVQKSYWRMLPMRLIEFIGRVGLFPGVTAFYLFEIHGQSGRLAMLAAMVVLAIMLGVREVDGLYNVIKRIMKIIKDKILREGSRMSDFALLERLLYNWWVHGKFSSSRFYIAKAIQEKNRLQAICKTDKPMEVYDGTSSPEPVPMSEAVVLVLEKTRQWADPNPNDDELPESTDDSEITWRCADGL